MEILKKLFPLSFKKKDSIGALIVNILIHIVADAIAGVIIFLLPILGFLGGLIGLYFTVGIVLTILDYLKILK